MSAWFRWMLRHRALVAAVVALVTVLAALSTSRATLSSSLQKLFFGESAVYDDYVAKARGFGSDEIIVVGYADPDPLSAESLARLDAASQALRALPAVATTHSLLTAPSIEGADGLLEVATWAERAEGLGRDERAALAHLAAEDPRVGGVFIDHSGAVGGAILVELTVDPDREGEAVPNLRDNVVSAFTDAGFARGDLHLTGLPVIVAGLIDQSRVNLTVLFPISSVVLLLAVLALFGRLAPALVALGVSLVAVIWTTGFAALLDPKFSIFLAVVPAVVVIVAFSDIIHLWSAWLTELRHGKRGEDAIVAAAEDVGKACLLTSATTFVGFVSLSLVPTPVFRQLGLVLGFGVSVALLLAVTLVPILQSLLVEPDVAALDAQAATPATTPWGRMGQLLQRLVDGVVAGSHRLSTQRPRSVVAGFAVVLAIAGYGLTQLHIDADFLERFRPGTTLRTDADWLGEHFVGSETFDVFVTLDEPEALLEDEAWAGLIAAHDALSELPGVEQTSSVVGLLDAVHVALGGEGRPEGRALVSQELLLFETAGGVGLDRFLSFERDEARLNVRLAPGPLRELAATSERAAAAVRAAVPEGAQVFAASLNVLLGDWVDEILAGQRNGVLASSLIIAAMMVVGLRSLKVGLMSMVPNLLPLLVMGGFLALVWDPVDSDTMIVAMMAIGIGVDDTVHFLMRYRLESQRTEDTAVAIERTFAFAGRAIVTTTVILGLGFLPLAAASYIPLQFVGVLLPTVLVLALVADLLLVPALVQLGWMRFAPGGPGGEAQGT